MKALPVSHRSVAMVLDKATPMATIHVYSISLFFAQSLRAFSAPYNLPMFLNMVEFVDTRKPGLALV